MDQNNLYDLLKDVRGKYYNVVFVEAIVVLYVGKKPNKRDLDKYYRDKMTEKIAEWIENASYAELLRHQIFAPVEDLMFQGEAGELFAKKIEIERKKLTPTMRSAILKKIRWD